MPRQFKPIRFAFMMGAVAFLVCAITAFYTQRASHGRTPEERAAYVIGERAGRNAPLNGTLPTAAALNLMAQEYFAKQGSGDKSNWDLAFEKGFEEGFSKTHRAH
jgi:hypothetical protein